MNFIEVYKIVMGIMWFIGFVGLFFSNIHLALIMWAMPAGWSAGEALGSIFKEG